MHPAIEHVLKFFTFDHLPEKLKNVSMPFAVLAKQVAERSPDNQETTVALRKLLEAKDAAVRAVLTLLVVLWTGTVFGQSKELNGPPAKASAKADLPTVVFVAIQPNDYPELVAALNGKATLEQRADLNGDAQPRVAVIAKNGRDEFYVLAPKINGQATADKLLRAWAGSDPVDPTRPPPRAGISDGTLSRSSANATGGNANVTININGRAPDPTLPPAVFHSPPERPAPMPATVQQAPRIRFAPPPTILVEEPPVYFERRVIVAEMPPPPPIIYSYRVAAFGGIVPYGAPRGDGTYATESGRPLSQDIIPWNGPIIGHLRASAGYNRRR